MISNKMIFGVMIVFVSAWSIVNAKDLSLWTAEASPAFIGLIVLFWSQKYFVFSRFAYTTITIGIILILIGAHFGYAYVPFGDWLKDYFSLNRNNYDRIGHFFQGFITAVIAKEVIIQKQLVILQRWINFFAFSVAAALSAIWEIWEWFVVEIFIMFGGEKPAEDFLGMQSDIWDTQSDMFAAILGALTVVLIFKRYHDKCIVKILDDLEEV